jgi:hypothetical protein
MAVDGNYSQESATLRRAGLARLVVRKAIKIFVMHITKLVEQCALQFHEQHIALRSRCTLDQPALMVAEAVTDLPADLIGIIAQYANSDFARQPYVSIYRQSAGVVAGNRADCRVCQNLQSYGHIQQAAFLWSSDFRVYRHDAHAFDVCTACDEHVESSALVI